MKLILMKTIKIVLFSILVPVLFQAVLPNPKITQETKCLIALLRQIKVSANGESTLNEALEKDNERAGLSTCTLRPKHFKRKKNYYPCTIQKKKKRKISFFLT
jgi:hypothetical protein